MIDTEDFARYLRRRIAEPNRPPDADAIYADGYEAGQRAAFEDVLRSVEGNATWRLWLDDSASDEKDGPVKDDA